MHYLIFKQPNRKDNITTHITCTWTYPLMLLKIHPMLTKTNMKEKIQVAIHY